MKTSVTPSAFIRLSCLLFLFGCVSVASAAEVKVPLAGLGWQIAFKAPTLKQYTYDYPAGSIQFRANAGRFNVSVFVEPPPQGATGGSHVDCRDFYWKQAKRNPIIVQDTVKQITHGNCEAVTYRSEGEFKGTPFVQDSVNCFFVHNGKWVDVHASIIEPTAEDTKQLSEFAAQLTYGAWQASSGQPEKIALEALGTLSFAPPAGWLVGNVLKDDTTLRGTIYTVSFHSPTDPNSSCLMSLSAPPKVPDSREALQQAVENSTAPAASASVEGKVVLQDLKLKKGIGLVASFTDARLVGKPIVLGNSKSITTGLLVPKPDVMLVVTMFSDDAKGDDARKMTQALETIVVE